MSPPPSPLLSDSDYAYYTPVLQDHIFQTSSRRAEEAEERFLASMSPNSRREYLSWGAPSTNDDTASQAIDNAASQGIDNAASQATNNAASQAIDNDASQATDDAASQATDDAASQDSESIPDNVTVRTRVPTFSNPKRKSRVVISPEKRHRIESKLNAGVPVATIASDEFLSSETIYSIRNAIKKYPDAAPSSLITDGRRRPDSLDLEAAINRILTAKCQLSIAEVRRCLAGLGLKASDKYIKNLVHGDYCTYEIFYQGSGPMSFPLGEPEKTDQLVSFLGDAFSDTYPNVLFVSIKTLAIHFRSFGLKGPKGKGLPRAETSNFYVLAAVSP